MQSIELVIKASIAICVPSMASIYCGNPNVLKKPAIFFLTFCLVNRSEMYLGPRKAVITAKTLKTIINTEATHTQSIGSLSHLAFV